MRRRSRVVRQTGAAGRASVSWVAADVVLLDKDLGVLTAGLREGRRAFSNTLKYIFITTSANFGNMVSMAIASLFTVFLPLLPSQILLIDFLTDVPSIAVATTGSTPSWSSARGAGATG